MVYIMSFLTPLALIGALVLGPIIVAMYLLKLRREERRVSSTFLWQRVVRDVEANAPWQKLRRNLLLLLQLLLLLLLVLALALPFFLTNGIAGKNLISSSIARPAWARPTARPRASTRPSSRR